MKHFTTAKSPCQGFFSQNSKFLSKQKTGRRKFDISLFWSCAKLPDNVIAGLARNLISARGLGVKPAMTNPMLA